MTASTKRLASIPCIQREAAAAVHAAENHTYMDTLRRLLPVLREHGVTRLQSLLKVPVTTVPSRTFTTNPLTPSMLRRSLSSTPLPTIASKMDNG